MRIQELQREIASLEARRFENVNLEDLQEQLVQASEQYEELSGEAPETPDTAELDAKLQEFHAKLGARSSEVYQPKYTGPLAEDTAKVQALGKTLSAERRAFEAVSAGYKLPGLPPCPLAAGISGVPSGFTGGNGAESLPTARS